VVLYTILLDLISVSLLTGTDHRRIDTRVQIGFSGPPSETVP